MPKRQERLPSANIIFKSSGLPGKDGEGRVIVVIEGVCVCVKCVCVCIDVVYYASSVEAR